MNVLLHREGVLACPTSVTASRSHSHAQAITGSIAKDALANHVQIVLVLTAVGESNIHIG